MRLAPAVRSPVFWFAALAVSIALVHGYALRWISDDAFISFRYLDQWFAGHGLVYNPGERVEGYTHPWWLLLLAILRPFGEDPTRAALGLGLLAYASLVFLVGRRFQLTAVVLAVHQEMAIWSTGGLETSLFTLEVVALLWVVARWEESRGRRFLGAGLVALATVLTRPDGAIFVLIAGILLVVWAPGMGAAARRDGAGSTSAPGVRRRAIFLFAAPLALALAPYLIWKLAYYGDLLPNTYYAKSGGGSWWSQGFYYLWTYFRGHPTTALGLAALPFVPGALRRVQDRDSRTLVAALGFALCYLLLFVARVGGDFMYARFVVPVIPLLFISGELVLRRIDGASRFKRWIPRIVLVLLPLLVILETPVLREPLFHDESRPDGRGRLRGIEDERWYWHHEVGRGENQIERYRRVGRELAEMTAGLDLTISVAGQASLAYYGRFPRVVEEHGLTEPLIARRPLAERGRPGHEKQATIEELRELGVDLRLFVAQPKDEPYRSIWFQIGDQQVPGELLRYDEALLTRLVERNGERIQGLSFPAYFDLWIRDVAPSLSRTERESVARGFEGYYFQSNDDPARRAQLAALLGEPAADFPIDSVGDSAR